MHFIHLVEQKLANQSKPQLLFHVSCILQYFKYLYFSYYRRFHHYYFQHLKNNITTLTTTYNTHLK